MTLFLIAVLAGMLTAFAPCILPLLPVIVGRSLGGTLNVRRLITVCAALGASILIFTLLLKFSTALIHIPQQTWAFVAGGIIVIFGIVTIFPALWERLPVVGAIGRASNRTLGSAHGKSSVWGDVVVGAALGPIFSSCSPTYFLILAAVLPVSFAQGLVYLTAYILGLVVVLFAIGFLGQKLLARTRWVADPHSAFRRGLGVLFVIVGLAIITGVDKKIEAGILEAGVFDVTTIEQKLLENVQEDEAESSALETKEPVQQLVRAPEITGAAGYLNTPDGAPITFVELRGKVVLVDFWTYSCINCQRTLPYVTSWYERYKDEGLVVVGVHTPEFAFEKVPANVAAAAEEFAITYPIVLDNDYATWNAFGNRYWPRKYLIDAEGLIVYDHIGEGAYDETEAAIRSALMKRAQALGTNADVLAQSAHISDGVVADTPVVATEKWTPELYFGAARNSGRLASDFAGMKGTHTFALSGVPARDHVALEGTWTLTRESAQSVTDGRIVLAYGAAKVFMVAGSADGAPRTMTVRVDGGAPHEIVVQAQTLYPLVEDDAYGTHTLEISVPAGVEAYTFTFG